MNKKVKNVFRWIAVLPASIVGTFIGYALIIFNGSIVRGYNGESTNVFSITDIIMFVLANVISGAAFVYVGTYTAPDYKKTTAILLTVLFSVFVTISGIMELSMNGIGSTFWGIVISLISAVGSCVKICNKRQEELEEMK
jgi:hypothetical protein